MLLFDTDHIGILQRQTHPAYAHLTRRMSRHPVKAFFFSIVSFHEEVMGWNTYISQAKKPAGVILGYHMLREILNSFGAA